MADPKPDSAGAAAAPAAAPKYPTVFRHATAKVDERRHKVTVGHGSVLHPVVTIRARNGPVVIGDYCILEEDCLIRNELPPRDDGSPATLVIGNYCVVGSRAEIYARKVGNHVRLLPYGRIGNTAEVGDACLIGAGCAVADATVVPPTTVVYGDEAHWRTRVPDTERDESEVIHISRFFRSQLS